MAYTMYQKTYALAPLPYIDESVDLLYFLGHITGGRDRMSLVSSRAMLDILTSVHKTAQKIH